MSIPNANTIGVYRTKTIRLHPDDNVASALQPLNGGETVQVGGIDGTLAAEIRLVEAVPLGHKFALRPIPAGGEVRKHGVVIGHATHPIAVGAWVSEHNLE